MAINYGRKYREFREELKKKHELYAQLEMSQEQIDALDEFDWTEFRGDCVYQVHTQPLEIASEPEFDETKNPLYKKFGDVLSVELKVTFRDKYRWLDDISSQALLEKLLSLSEDDLEILDAYVFGEKKYREIGEANKVTPQCIYKKIQRIKKFLAD